MPASSDANDVVIWKWNFLNSSVQVQVNSKAILTAQSIRASHETGQDVESLTCFCSGAFEIKEG